MSQQQLLIMMLAVIIVGAAVMAGSNQFEKDFNTAMQDEMRKVIVSIAVRAQLWYRSPADYGGKRSFSDFSLDKINTASYYSMLGNITLTNKLPSNFRIIGAIHGDSNWKLVVDVYPDSLVVTH